MANTKRAIKAINPDLDVDIYDETNNSVEAVIHNRWMVPITWVAEQCSMSAVQVLEEHLFASGLNVDTVGKMEFLKARANLKGYDLTAVVCSTLKYEDGTSVYADTTEEDRK